MSVASFAAGSLIFVVSKSQRSQWIPFMIAPLWGCFASLLFKHGWGASRIQGERSFESSDVVRLVLMFSIGFFIFWALDFMFKRQHVLESHSKQVRKAKKHVHVSCSHAHQGQEFFHFTGVLPHSLFDGLIWGLSLGFNSALSQQVFLVLLIHRLIETSSWMSAFRTLKAHRFFLSLGLMVGSFALAAYIGSQWHFLPAEARQWLMWLFVGSLGYLVAAIFEELKEQVLGIPVKHRIFWALTLVLGFLCERLLLAPFLNA